MHGSYIFRKIIEIDVDKIREEKKDSQTQLDEIRDFIVSLLPEQDRLY